ncbi:MAG: D-tyrosyl-tRNA(Tyr) deacylase [Thermoguttaceae bacterium]|nr:D-tyrosyl-tRNA(Tyr) deacylase [Thermoguttaceae bacterium]
MRVCLQRVSQAKVSLPDENDRVSGKIERGFLVLLGVGRDDEEEDAKYLAKKTAGMRVFEDENGKMNLNLEQVGGRVLVVSQFTLFADCVKGNRPSFVEAAPPEKAKELYRTFVSELNALGVSTEEGVFQANMSVSLVNDGPVTIWIDSDDGPLGKKKMQSGNF